MCLNYLVTTYLYEQIQLDLLDFKPSYQGDLLDVKLDILIKILSVLRLLDYL